MDEYDDLDRYQDSMGYDEFEEQQQHDQLYKKLTDFSPYLQQLIMEWLGMYWDDNENKYVRDPKVPPTMNLKCARWCVTQLRTYTRDNNILTRVGDKAFKYMMQDIVKTVWLNIGTRAEEFGIKSHGDIMAVCNQLIHSAELVLVGTTGNKVYADTMAGTYRYSEGAMPQQRMPAMQPQQKGFIGTFKRVLGWKK